MNNVPYKNSQYKPKLMSMAFHIKQSTSPGIPTAMKPLQLGSSEAFVLCSAY